MDLNRLEARVQELMQQSGDAVFTEYLCQMRSRIISEQHQIDLLSAELEKFNQVYQANRQAVQRTEPIQQSVPQPVAPPSMQPTPQPVAQPVYQPTPQPVAQPVYQPTPQPVASPVYQPTPQPGGQQRVQYMAQPVQQQFTRQAKPKRNMEFTVGAAVLSIVGGVFVLIALMLLGMNFLDGFAKGMCLYAICLIVMLVSETLLYRKWPKLGMTFSAIGMGGLYLTTLINYLVLENFHMWVAVGLTVAITAGVIALSRRRNAISYRILGMAAVYISMLMLPTRLNSINGGISQGEFLVVAAIMFLINVMCLAVPVLKSRTAVNVTHLVLNTVFTIFACAAWEDNGVWDSVAKMWHYPMFIGMSMIVMQLIFISQVRWQAKQKPDGKMSDNALICTVYAISGIFYLIMAGMTTDFSTLIAARAASDSSYILCRLVCAAIVLVICAIPLVVLRKRQERWFSWYLGNLVLLGIYFNVFGGWEWIWCIAALLVANKLLSLKKNKMLYISDFVITIWACIMVLAYHAQAYAIPLVVILFLSILCISYWKTATEIILTFTIAFYISGHMLSMLMLPVFVGILFAGMLIFNNVKRWRDNNILVYNIMAVIGQVICYLLLLNPKYHNAYLTYLCMLIFGVSTIIICFQQRYRMNFRFKEMVLPIFLTYMALIIRTKYPIVNSILMMVIALISVGMGFAERKKNVRIYGLVLSLLVCFKIVRFDFMGAPILQKTILFFVTGVLALVISAIYIILEKRLINSSKNPEVESNQEERGAV